MLFHEISMLPETKIMYEKRDGYEINKMVHLYFLNKKKDNELEIEIRSGNQKIKIRIENHKWKPDMEIRSKND